MIFFLIIILIAGGFYVLGAKNGIPKFDFFGKKENELAERIEFLSELKSGDRINTFKFDDEDAFKYDFNRNYTITNNDPINQEIDLKEYSTIDLRSYENKCFYGVVKKNDALVQAIIRRNREKNEGK